MAAVLQQQMRAAGIRLNIRSAEFGTFYADVTRGAFQIYALRWIGSNEDPDIFRYAYASGSFPLRAAIGVLLNQRPIGAKCSDPIPRLPHPSKAM